MTDSTEHSQLPGFMRIAEYRPDHGHRAWAARCWGDGGCDGWLSLDHTTERWAQQAARRHLAEDHPDSTRTADTGQDSTPDTPTQTGRTPQVSRGGQQDSGAGGGYCPACGRGDCAPTADQWYAERQRADRAEAALDRVRAECDAIEAEVYSQRDEDDDGMREAVRRILAALGHPPADASQENS